MYYGGVLCGRAVYCLLWQCNICYGGVLCYGRCTVCYGGVLYVMVVYCVVGRCTVCYGGVLCVVSMYCVL